MKPEIKKTLTGKFVVKYECSQCGEGLESPLAEVGAQDTCPNCKHAFVVPGRAEKEQLARQQQAARDAKELQLQQKRAATEKQAKDAAATAAKKNQLPSQFAPPRPRGPSYRKHDYPAMNVVATVYRVLACILGILGIIGCAAYVVVGISSSAAQGNPLGLAVIIGSVAVTLVVIALAVISLLFVAESIKVILDIENNTHATLHAVQNNQS